MPRCSAASCRNMGSHTFPKDPYLRSLWEKATNKENFKATKHSRLCYDHFTPSDYVDVCLSTGISPFHRYLKKTAVPSIFPSKAQQSTSGTSVIEERTAGRQQISRHLKNGVVPSIFPWTKKSATASDATQQQKASSDPNTNKILKKTAVPSIFSTPSRSFVSYASSFHQKKNLMPPTKNNDLKNNAVSPQNAPKNEEINSSEINIALRNRSMRLKNRKAYLLNRRCSVPHCNTRPSNEISLHPCPNNAAVRNEWAEALRVSYQYVKNMVACSLHFTKLDFIQSKNSERVLKHSAVPSHYLPNRKKIVVPVKNKLLRKAKAYERQQTMTDTVGETKEAIQEEVTRECRACLKKLDDKKSCCNVFQAWAPPWDGMEATIAEDLAKLANVEISVTDRHSKVLCAPCYQRLLDAATFSSKVRNCDLLLRMRFTADIDMEKVWPKPIQVDKNINGSVFNNPMDIDIKQEVLSDEEYPVNGTDNLYVETELANLDIKIEPEELVEPPPMNITINGTISLDPLNSENKDVNNETGVQQDTQYIEMELKQEPTSEGEQEIEQSPDLSLECLLCTKSFHSVTGLKAHVIAHHSYKTVKRKADGSVSPEKKRCDQYQCAICKRSFQTSTDLMVHETCHNKHSCYGCTEKFDSFELLSRHRKRCKANIGNSVQKLKTLDDVKRPLPGEKVEYLEAEIEKIGTEPTSKVEEDIEMKESETIKDVDVEMKDLHSERREENSEENQVDYNEENDKKPESVEVEYVKQLESIIQDQEVGYVTESESGVIQEQEVDECGTSFITLSDSIPFMESESVIEKVDDDKQLPSVIEEVDYDKTLESVVQEVDNGNKLESVVEAEDNKLESLITEEESVTLKTESLIEEENVTDTAESETEKFVTEEKKTVSENIEIEENPDSNMKLNLELHSTQNETEPTLSDADMPVVTLDNDECT